MSKQHTLKTWRVIYVGSSDWDLDGPITQEDWQLAAAAPDLLGALHAMLSYTAELDPMQGLDGHDNPAVNQASAAIAKATGKNT